ncbi:MAG: adenylate/guanylate cyclase domain-containing protein [Rhodospirillales bacterium]
MSDPGQETFDIYGKKGPRWSFVERFPAVEKDRALARAAELDRGPDYEAIRVMEVRFSARTGKALENLAWMSPSADRRFAPKKPTGPRRVASAEGKVLAQVGGGADSAQGPGKREKAPARAGNGPVGTTAPTSAPTKATQPASAGRRVAVLVPLALVVSLALGYGLIALLAKSGGVDPASLQRFSYLIMGGVALVAVALALTFALRGADLRGADLDGREAEPVTGSVAPLPSTASSPLASASGFAGTDLSGPPSESGSLEDDIESLRRELGHTLGDEAENGGSEPGEADAEKVTHDSRITMIRFLEGAIMAIKDQLPRLDSYNTFGINLFLAGSANAFANKLELAAMQRFVLMRGALETLGTKAENIQLFLEKYETYSAEPKNRVMVEAGGRAMARFLEGSDEAFAEFPRVMRTWNDKSALAAQAGGIVVILFTDLVGSTAMTQEKGDVGAQKVVRAHNAIVRSALAHYGGKEVKHTGDGIMASFNHGPRSVKACLQMQRDLARHNASHPDLPVKVRMGLNAGAAIEEEDDFYGQTVQLSARVCDKAGTAEIFATESLKGLCEGQGFQFDDAGQYELKGIEGKVPLYRIDWKTG